MGSTPPSPESLCDLARSDTPEPPTPRDQRCVGSAIGVHSLDLAYAFDQFPSEQTFDKSPAVRESLTGHPVGIDLHHWHDTFPTEEVLSPAIPAKTPTAPAPVSLRSASEPVASEMVTTARRFAAAAIVFTGIVATGMMAIAPPDGPGAAATVEPRSTAVESAAPIGPLGPSGQDRPSTPPLPSTPAGASTAAIQRVLNRYRDAHSTLDVSAVVAAWPTVNRAALRRRFAELTEHNVEFDSCRIAVADTRASAVCLGVTQSVRVGDGTTTTERRQWQFALDQVEGRWSIASVDVR